MSTLFVNNLNTASGSTITVPTGKQVIITDEGGLRVPGTVIQVVQNTSTTQFSQGGTSFSDTNLNATITPKYQNSKILISVKQQCTFRMNTSAERAAYTRIQRDDGTQITNQLMKALVSSATVFWFPTMFAVDVFDTPNRTNSVTYKTQGRLSNSAADLYYQHDSAPSTMILMEIAQ